MQIVNGTAGIGKSAFLLYMLARLQSDGKSVLLHAHRYIANTLKPCIFPRMDLNRQGLNASAKTFDAWYRAISEDNSVILMDGIVSFTLEDYPNIKYIAAKSPICSIGWMDKAQMRRDRWLKVWQASELLSYAQQVNIPNMTKESITYMTIQSPICHGILRNNFRNFGKVYVYVNQDWKSF